MPNEKTVTEVLRGARALIERGWTQGSWAKTARGRSCQWDSRRAVCHCAEGAMYAAGKSADAALGAALVLESVVRRHIPSWNDAKCRTKAQVLEAFDKAIKLSEAAA